MRVPAKPVDGRCVYGRGNIDQCSRLAQMRPRISSADRSHSMGALVYAAISINGGVRPYVPAFGLGRGQVVRHRFLVSAFAGSNPAAPAIFRKSAALLNVQDGTCRCAQHVEGDTAAEEAP